MALFELTDLAGYLQSDLDTATATICRDIAAGVIAGYTRQRIEEADHTHTVEVSPGLVATLPQRPVTAVDTVTVDGVQLADDGWSWDGIGPWLVLAEPPTTTWTATVAYTAGYATVPADVRAVALAAAGRAYSNSLGVRSEAIDDYSVTYAGGGDTIATVGLLPAEAAILDRYRAMVAAVRLR